MATLIFPFVAVDGNGHVRASAKLYFYQTGTSTPQATYSDSALSVTNTNPVVADSNGLFTGIYLGEAPDFMAYKAILKDSSDVTIWTQDPIAGAPIAAPISASLLRDYLDGLAMTSRTNTTITYAAGVCADSANDSMLSLAAGTINCATVGADGLDAGALGVSTWYHSYAIGKTDGTVARLASTSATSPTMPSGYTLKRRIGSFKTDGSSQIINFVQDGDEFQYVTLDNTVTGSNPGTSAVTKTLPVPTGLRVKAVMQFILQNNGVGSGTTAYISDLSTTDTAPTQGANPVGDFPNTITAAAGAAQASQRLEIWTNTSAQVRVRLSFSDANVGYTLNTLGWIDRRGRDA